MNTKQIAPCAVILAGGMGKRLRPLTETTPKPLLPVLGKPLLYHILQRLELMGVETAYLMTGYLSDRMESAVAAYEGKLKPICIKEETPMGSAGCLSLVEQAGQWQSCIVVSADDLQVAQIAQINAIVYEQTGILPSAVTIIHK